MRNRKYIYRNLLAILIGIPLTVLSVISMNFFITIVILSIAVFIFLLSLKSRFDLLLKTISLFILIHFVVFPYLYVFLIKYDPKSYLIDTIIEQNEIIDAKNEIQGKYKPNELEKSELISSRLLLSKNTYLDSSFEIICNNIIFIDSFLLYKNISYYEMPEHGAVIYTTLSIFNSKGENLVNIVEDKENKISNELTIRKFLNKSLIQIKETKKQLEMEEVNVEKKDIWTYKRILAYSINIFDTDNIKPKTRLSNIIFFFHKLLVAIFIFGIIGTSFYDFIIDKRKK